MANFCPNCGQPVNAGDVFCRSCGIRLSGAAPATDRRGAQSDARDQADAWERDDARDTTYARMGIPAPGYSKRINDPEIMKAMKKSKRASAFLGIFIIPLPLIGFVIYASVTGDMEIADAAKNGLFVSAVFLVFAVISSLKQRAQNSYEGVVIDKKILNQRTRRMTYSQRRRAGIDDNDNSRESYVTYVRTSSGQVKKITEHTTMFHSAWSYLEIGDRFMYHPQLHFPYEKYDKTHETHLYCVGCLKKNPITADRCSKCGLPLLK